MAALNGRKVAVLATDGFEQVEPTEPVKALMQAGADVSVIAPKAGEIQCMNHHEKGQRVTVAGAEWSDQEVVVDGELVTSRKPDDLPAFCRQMLALFAGNVASKAA